MSASASLLLHICRHALVVAAQDAGSIGILMNVGVEVR
ncbi:hypothetical protein BURPS1710A_A2584 [Burkholderia pseudomallei 1710a]|uniref:Uncharacterized protein n=1 Tax=Burkholderia pseudomallei 1710a TaxID=320371 RepID=A0A0E1W699_BURPE|nr:hypothetical protein BURPS1710A_A2584 [Burkholderia pseudomallei 1710a]